MTTIRRIKISFYAVLILGVLICSYYVFRWNIYPWLHIEISLLIPLMSLSLTEFIKTPNKNIQISLLVGAFVQLVLALLILLNSSLVLDLWRFIFYPSIFVIMFSVYAVCKRKKEKYQRLFNSFIAAILFLSLLRFFYFHVVIDYGIETLFLILIILIYRSKEKKESLEEIENKELI